jgi:hypothetical protein
MPLIIDADRVPEATLRTMAKELTGELEEILASLADRGPAKDPLGVVTAADLLRSAIDLGHATEGAPVALTAAVVNVEYEALVASIDLIKSHFGLPTVPRGRAPPA